MLYGHSQSVLQVVGIVGAPVILNGVLLIPAILITIIFLRLRRLYLNPSSDLRKMGATGNC